MIETFKDSRSRKRDARHKQDAGSSSTRLIFGIFFLVALSVYNLTHERTVLQHLRESGVDVDFASAYFNKAQNRSTTFKKDNEARRLAEAKKFVETDLAQHKIVVYAKSMCRFSKQTKRLLRLPEFDSVDKMIRDVDTLYHPSWDVLNQTLIEITGQMTVPNIFIDGKYFGDNEDLHAAFTNRTLDFLN